MPIPSRLIAVLLIAVSAAAAHAQTDSASTDAAVRARLKSDLRNLVVSQEAYYADHSAYADDITKLKFRASTGSQVQLVVTQNNAWAAVGTDDNTPGKSCTIWINLPQKLRPATMQQKYVGTEGAPTCDGDPAPVPKG